MRVVMHRGLLLALMFAGAAPAMAQQERPLGFDQMVIGPQPWQLDIDIVPDAIYPGVLHHCDPVYSSGGPDRWQPYVAAPVAEQPALPLGSNWYFNMQRNNSAAPVALPVLPDETLFRQQSEMLLSEFDIDLLTQGLASPDQYARFSEQFAPVVGTNLSLAVALETQILEASAGLRDDLGALQWQRNAAHLQAAVDQGNPAAMALLGSAMLEGRGLPVNIDGGIELLTAAAARGVPSAYTDLGALGLDLSGRFDRAQSLTYLEQGLDLGDGNAAYFLAPEAAKEDFYAGVDLNATVIGMGTGPYPELARQRLVATCTEQSVACVPLQVGVVTSRAKGDLGAGQPWLDSSSAEHETNFTLATTMVPFLKADLAGEPAPAQDGANVPGDFAKSTFLMNGFMSRQAFVGRLSGASQAGDGRFLIYVHGFNNSVEDALLAVARMKQRGNLPGTPLIYSWPAGKELVRYNFFNWPIPAYSGYSRDVQMASNSCFAFRQFLVEFSNEVGPQNIILVGHSHGAKLLHNALTDCEFRQVEPPAFAAPFHSVIYAAPDIDLDQFTQSFDQLQGKAERIALYLSANDFAIQASEDAIRGGLPRLGGASMTDFGPGIEVIDATAITDRWQDSGHSYAFVQPEALHDMRRFIAGEAAPRQPCQSAMTNGAAGYWLKVGCVGP